MKQGEIWEEPEEEQDAEVPLEVETEEFDFYSLSSESEVDIVSAGIEEKYGFTPSDEYVQDLIKFVNDMLYGGTEDATSDVPS